MGVDDYLNSQTTANEHFVVARIGTLFALYNRKEGVNGQVAGDGDTVTVVEQDGPQKQSWKRAALTEGSTPFRQRNWDGTNKNLVIQVCERSFGTPDCARVLVYLEGSSNPTCADKTQSGPMPPTESFNSCLIFDGSRRKCRGTKYRRSRCSWNQRRGRKCFNKRP